MVISLNFQSFPHQLHQVLLAALTTFAWTPYMPNTETKYVFLLQVKANVSDLNCNLSTSLETYQIEQNYAQRIFCNCKIYADLMPVVLPCIQYVQC